MPNDTPLFILQARDGRIASLVLACAKREIGFDELGRKIADMGYNTDSLFEMVVQAERLLPSQVERLLPSKDPA